MYKLLLISKYLYCKLAPLFAALAVMLCTAMVIIVICVMGGFLNMLRDSAHKLSGDCIITGGSYTGFPYYQQMLIKLDKNPAIGKATPVIRSYGLIHLENNTIPVQVVGINPQDFNQVVPYQSTLRWSGKDYMNTIYGPAKSSNQKPTNASSTEKPLPKGPNLKYLAMNLNGKRKKPANAQRRLTLKLDNRAPAVLGIALSPYSSRDPQGHYHFANSSVGRTFVLTVVPVSKQGVPAQTSLHQMISVNEFKSGLYSIDSKRVYVGFNLLQKMLFMNATQKIDPLTGNPTGQKVPARVNEILIKAAPGYSEQQVRLAAQQIINSVMRQHPNMPPVIARTWQQRYHTILSAVENEKGLVTFLFVIISIVAVVMVATTFYMTVLEKTRDIGILRAVGSSRLGIMSLFLGYGLAIGIVGAAVGLGLAWAIVTHLNQIQNIIADLTGWRMWNPQVYAFDHIPDTMLWFSAGIIAAGAVVSSVIGALIPAIVAGLMNPITALRHE